MGARMRLLAIALAILMMVSSCLAAKVLKSDELLQHEGTIVHGSSRQLLEDEGENPRSTNNHHYIPRNKYPGGGVASEDVGGGDGSG